MRYFLKKTTPSKKGLYLQIYQSMYIPQKGKRNKSYQTVGYVSDLIANGIADPITHYQGVVDKLNEELISKECLQIGEASVTKNLGYFLIKGILDLLKTDETIDLVTINKNFKFKVSDFIRTMIYAQIINPGSKLAAYENVIPNIYNVPNFTYDQILDCVNYLGQDFEKYIEVYNHQIEKVFGKRKVNTTYFDCTNYYFEIDMPFEDKQKGPSKEKRSDPIISQALLLDEDQIPIAMQMFPGNQSEKPQIRKIIEDIKERYNISSKIVQVADKGLNCAQNIYAACIESNDGYIFSKSFKGRSLSSIEKEWILLSDNKANKWTEYRDIKGNVEFKLKECVDNFSYHFKPDENSKEEIKFTVKEKRIVSFNEKLAKKQRAEILKQVDNLAKKISAKSIAREELGDAVKFLDITHTTKDGEVVAPYYFINQEKVEEELKYAGYNLIVTSETQKSAKEIYNAYHGLWRIEESFRILKSYLEARPVFLQTKESIYGHFLICYLALTVLRLLELKIFNDDLPMGKIIEFIRKYIVTQTLEGSFVSGATLSTTHKYIKNKLGLSKLGNVYLTKKDVDTLLNLHLDELL